MAEDTRILKIEVDAQAATNSIKALTTENAKLRKERNLLSRDTVEGSKRIDEINSRLDLNTDKIKANSSSLEKQRLNVGNYTKSIIDAVPGLGKFSGGVTGLNTAFKANPIGLVITALIALKSIFSQNAVVADKLSFLLAGFNKGLQSIIDSVVSTVTSMTKLKEAFLNPIDAITSFFKKTKEASVAGYEAAEAMDSFGAAQAKATQAIRIADIQITSLEKSLKDRTKSEQERIGIANQIADMEIANADRRAKIASDELANEQKRLKGKTLSGEEETKLVELETSVFEANEEKKIVAASRTTRINILLAKEQADGKKAIKDEEQLREDEEAIRKETALQLEEARNIKKQEDDQKRLDEKLSRKESEEAAEAAREQAAADAEYARYVEAANKKIALEEMIKNAKIFALGQTFSIAQGLFKRESAAYKVLAVARATVDAYSAASQALKTYPYPIGGIFAALAIAQGLANVASINGVQFADGGYTGDGGKYEPKGVVHGGEFVIPKETVGRLGVGYFNQYLPQYADGGYVKNQITQPIDQQAQTASIMKSMPRPVMDYKEFTEFAQRVEFKENATSL